MVQINFAQKSVTVKIVYYGPGMSGKTTNLEVVHQRAPNESRGDLTSISTDGDRTLFFDFMPLDLGTVAGMRTQLQIYTVPGQVYYNSTRKLVLQGVDGVIFVADSSASMMEENLESLRDLGENLAEYGKDLQSMPMVMQYNKRDMPDALPVGDLEQALNSAGRPSHEAVANTGQGVFPTLKALASLVLDSIHNKTSVANSEAPSLAAPMPSGGTGEVPAGPPVASVPPLPSSMAPSRTIPTATSASELPVTAMRAPITPEPNQEVRGPVGLHGGPPSVSPPTEERAAAPNEPLTVEPILPGSHLQMAQAPAHEQSSPERLPPVGGSPPLETHLRMERPMCPDSPQGGQGLSTAPRVAATGADAVAGAPLPNSPGSVMGMSGQATVAQPPVASRALPSSMPQRIRPRQSVRAMPAHIGRRKSAMITIAFVTAALMAGVAIGGLTFQMF